MLKLDMQESLIGGLEVQSYGAHNPREQGGTVGEKSAIREIDPTDRIDVQRIFDIDRRGAVKKFMVGKEKTEQESIDWANLDVHMFAVSGSEGVPKSEVGELQGWIWFARDKKERLERTQDQGLLTLADGAELLEVSFAKYESAPPGQMASGLRQACDKVARLRVSEEDAKLIPDTIITAYVSPENIDSIHVLEASGFVAKGEIVYDPAESGETDVLYVLDWNKLNGILHEKADKVLFGELKDS